ncbi:MAG: hypothetical protein GY906_00615, partial [bacterium]|nr:hypothetical protein [bacterium]
MNKARTSFHAVQWVVIIAVAAGLGLGIQTAHSQVFSYDRLVYDGTGGNTTGFQCNTRPHRGEPFSWGGKDYLLAHVGTDVQVFKLDEPGGSPVTRAKIGAGYDCSGFFDDNPPYIPFGPPVEIEWLEGHGESSNADGIAVKTHTLANDGIKGAVTCDECRYAVVDANNHSVVVDLSAPTSSGEPEVIGKWIIEDDFKVTYRVGSTQYLMGVRSS